MFTTRARPRWLELGSLLILFLVVKISANETDLATMDCYYNYNHYSEGDRILTNEPCLNCTCHNKMLMCYLKVCPFTKPIGQDCTIEKREDQCCPIITCPEVPVELDHSITQSSTDLAAHQQYGCSIENVFYPEGAQIPGNTRKPCELCYCIRNMTSCVMQECTLHVDGCRPIYNKGVCCPVRYDCAHDLDEIPLLEDSQTTTEPPSQGFVITTTNAPVQSSDCLHNGERYVDGELITTDQPCEHCYCMRGDIVCAVQECGRPLEMHSKNCTARLPQEGECCPQVYDCNSDRESITTTLIDGAFEAATTLATEDIKTDVLTTVRSDVDSTTHAGADEAITESNVPTTERIDESENEIHDKDYDHITVKPSRNYTSQQVPQSLDDRLEVEDSSTLGNKLGDVAATTIVADLGILSDEHLTTVLPPSSSQITEKPVLGGEDEATEKESTERESILSNLYTTIKSIVDLTTTLSPIRDSGAPHKQTSDEENSFLANVIPGEGDCLENSVSYANSSSVPVRNKCEISCVCLNSIVQCEQTKCSPMPPNAQNCKIVHDPNACCLSYFCESMELTTSVPSIIESESQTTQINEEQNIDIATATSSPDEELEIKTEGNVEAGATESSADSTTIQPAQVPHSSKLDDALELLPQSATDSQLTAIAAETVSPEGETNVAPSVTELPATEAIESITTENKIAIEPIQTEQQPSITDKVVFNYITEKYTPDSTTMAVEAETEIGGVEHEQEQTTPTQDNLEKVESTERVPEPVTDTLALELPSKEIQAPTEQPQIDEISEEGTGTTIPPTIIAETPSEVSAQAPVQQADEESGFEATTDSKISDNLPQVSQSQEDDIAGSTQSPAEEQEISTTQKSETQEVIQATEKQDESEISSTEKQEFSAQDEAALTEQPPSVSKENESVDSEMAATEKSPAQPTVDDVTTEKHIEVSAETESDLLPTEKLPVTQTLEDATTEKQFPIYEHHLYEEKQPAIIPSGDEATESVTSAQVDESHAITTEKQLEAEEEHSEIASTEKQVQGLDGEISSTEKQMIAPDEQAATDKSIESQENIAQVTTTESQLLHEDELSTEKQPHVSADEKEVDAFGTDAIPSKESESATTVKPIESFESVEDHDAGKPQIIVDERQPIESGTESQLTTTASSQDFADRSKSTEKPLDLADEVHITTEPARESVPATTENQQKPQYSDEQQSQDTQTNAPSQQEITEASIPKETAKTPTESQTVEAVTQAQPDRPPTTTQQVIESSTDAHTPAPVTVPRDESITESFNQELPTTHEPLEAVSESHLQLEPTKEEKIDEQKPDHDVEQPEATTVPASKVELGGINIIDFKEGEVVYPADKEEDELLDVPTTQQTNAIEPSAPEVVSQNAIDQQTSDASTISPQKESIVTEQPIEAITATQDEQFAPSVGEKQENEPIAVVTTEQQPISEVPATIASPSIQEDIDIVTESRVESATQPESLGESATTLAPRVSLEPIESVTDIKLQPDLTTQVPSSDDALISSSGTAMPSESATESEFGVERDHTLSPVINEQSVPTEQQHVEITTETQSDAQTTLRPDEKQKPEISTEQISPQQTSVASIDVFAQSEQTTFGIFDEKATEKTIEAVTEPEQEELEIVTPSKSEFDLTGDEQQKPQFTTESAGSLELDLTEKTYEHGFDGEPAATSANRFGEDQPQGTTLQPIEAVTSEPQQAITESAAQQTETPNPQAAFELSSTEQNAVDITTLLNKIRDEGVSEEATTLTSISDKNELAKPSQEIEPEDKLAVNAQTTISSVDQEQQEFTTLSAGVRDETPAIVNAVAIGNAEGSENCTGAADEGTWTTEPSMIASDNQIYEKPNVVVSGSDVPSFDHSTELPESAPESTTLTEVQEAVPGHVSTDQAVIEQTTLSAISKEEPIESILGENVSQIAPIEVTDAQVDASTTLKYDLEPATTKLSMGDDGLVQSQPTEANILQNIIEGSSQTSEIARPETTSSEFIEATNAPISATEKYAPVTSQDEYVTESSAQTTESELDEQKLQTKPSILDTTTIKTLVELITTLQPMKEPVIYKDAEITTPQTAEVITTERVFDYTTPYNYIDLETASKPALYGAPSADIYPTENIPLLSVNRTSEPEVTEAQTHASPPASANNIPLIRDPLPDRFDEITTKLAESLDTTTMPSSLLSSHTDRISDSTTVKNTQNEITEQPNRVSGGASPVEQAAAPEHSEQQKPSYPSSPPYEQSGGYGNVPSQYPDEEYTDEEEPAVFGPGTCRYGGKLYVSAQQIPRDDPCDFCFCFRSDIICLQQSCPPPINGCHEEPIQGFCCPRYECPVSMALVLNSTTTTTTTLPPHLSHFSRSSSKVTRSGCQIQGVTYKIGEPVTAASGPCIDCICGGDGQMKCEPKVCTPEPMLRQMIAVAASRR